MLIARFLSDDSAATAVEYAVLAMMIALVMIAGAGTFFYTMQDLYEDNGSELVAAITGS